MIGLTTSEIDMLANQRTRSRKRDSPALSVQPVLAWREVLAWAIPARRDVPCNDPSADPLPKRSEADGERYERELLGTGRRAMRR